MCKFTPSLFLVTQVNVFSLLLEVKEAPRVNKTWEPVEDQKSQLFTFSAILLEFSCICVKYY